MGYGTQRKLDILCSRQQKYYLSVDCKKNHVKNSQTLKNFKYTRACVSWFKESVLLGLGDPKKQPNYSGLP